MRCLTLQESIWREFERFLKIKKININFQTKTWGG